MGDDAASVLASLDDADFTDAMKHALWKDSRWAAFMDDAVVDRTYQACLDLNASLIVQLTSDSYEERSEWHLSVMKLRARVQARMGQAKTRVKEMNAAESATLEAIEAKWAALAETLAGVVEGSGDHRLLDVLTMPKDDSFTVREWLTARRAQQARKAKRRELEKEPR